MKIEKYPYGWIVNGKKIITDKLYLDDINLQAPIVKDTIKYLKTGVMSPPLKEFTETYGQAYVNFGILPRIVPTEYEPTKQLYGRKFLLTELPMLSDIYETYVYEDDPDYRIVYENLVIDTEHYTVYYYHPGVPRKTRLGKKIEEKLFEKEELIKILEKAFPAFGEKTKVHVDWDRVYSYSMDLTIVEKDDKFEVFYRMKPAGWYIYGCGKRISKYGFDPEKVPCYRHY